MRKSTSPQKIIFMFTMAVALTAITGFLGSSIVRALRKTVSPLVYWIGGIVVVAALWTTNAQLMAVYVGTVWMTLGAYHELEVRGFRWWNSGIISICLAAMVAIFGLWQVLVSSGISNWERARSYGLEVAEKVIAAAGASGKILPEYLLQQMPSAFVILLIFTLAFGLIFERNTFSFFGLPQKRVAARINIAEFRLPAFFVWIALASFFFAMVDLHMKEVAVVFGNMLNIVVVLYFFQGVAVFEALLNFLRAGVVTRVLGYLIMIGQLMLILSVVGFADYWMDFRRKLNRMKFSSENQN